MHVWDLEEVKKKMENIMVQELASYLHATLTQLNNCRAERKELNLKVENHREQQARATRTPPPERKFRRYEPASSGS